MPQSYFNDDLNLTTTLTIGALSPPSVIDVSEKQLGVIMTVIKVKA